MRVNYDKNSFCSNCNQAKPIELIRCDVCSFRLRHKKHNKNTWWARHREEIMKNSHRRTESAPTWPTQMRKIRVKRILAGLKPNIPLPETDI